MNLHDHPKFLGSKYLEDENLEDEPEDESYCICHKLKIKI